MADWNAVRCMRHCSSDFNIFFVNFPEYCPICGGILKGSYLIVPPFCVPSPFVSSSEVPYSVLVKPTDGCFLKTYQSGHNLHIGITTSTGLVYNYDEDGIHVDKETAWSLCVALNLSNILELRREFGKSNDKDWDNKLKHHSQRPIWTSQRYNPSSHNCYSFALSFLTTFSPERHNFKNKDTFCKDYIVPLTTRAAQYIDLYRKVLDNGTLVMKASAA